MTVGRFAYWSRLANALSISRRELNWAALAACLIIALTCVPYVYGWAITPPGMAYMGYIYEPADHAVHSAWLRQAMMGKVLFEDLFTTEAQSPHFFQAYFLLLGQLARLLHLPLMAVEQLGRIFFGWAFLVVAYAFAAQFTESVFTRRLALLLIGLSSGLGWLVNAQLLGESGPWPPPTWAMDYAPHLAGLIMPEAITFASLMIFGLFAVSYFLLIVSFYLLWLAWQRGSWRLAAWAGLAAMALANVHSYDIITVWAVGAAALCALQVSQRGRLGRQLGMLALVVALSIIPVLYQYHVFQTSRVFREKANTPTWSPPPFDERVGRKATDYLVGEMEYVLTFGLCAFAAVPAMVRAVRRRNPGWLYLTAWALVPFVLVYLPFRFQRKIAEGMQVPLCILAALAIGDMILLLPGRSAPRKKKGPARRMSPALQWGAALIFIGLTVPSNVALAKMTMDALALDSGYRVRRLERPYFGATDFDLYPPFYMHVDEIKALKWVTAHSDPRDAVLSLTGAGVYLPRVAERYAYCAHWAETLDRPRKMFEVMRFFGRPVRSPRGELLPPMTDTERLALARDNRIRYVYYSYAEKGIAKVRPGQMKCLELTYRNPRVEIYRFKPLPALRR